MKGLRTVLFNGLIVIATALLTWVVGVDWAAHVNPTIALVIVGAANIGLRWLTTTPIGQSQ